MVTNVLIFEDNDNLRESIVTLLQSTSDLSVVGSFSNCLDVVNQAQSTPPDIILMDIDMPGMSGIEAVRQIRNSGSTVAILMLTVFDDTAHVYDAICAGASGYLLKKHIAERLVVSIQDVLSGGAPMSPSIARMVIQTINTNSKPLANTYELTTREQEILASLSSGNSYKLIAGEFKISLDTVRTHIKHIYEKLQVHSQTEAVSKAIHEKLI